MKISEKIITAKENILNNKKLLKNILKISGITLLSFYIVTAGVRAYTLRKAPPLPELTQAEKESLEETLNQNYPERINLIHPLPYKTKPVELDVWAKSAIAVDTKSGSVIYEKNADEIIPPASMTKLFVMYIIMEEIEAGNAKLTDLVPLPPETWASRQPPHSSLMFLGKGQKVTLEEVITGLDVCSGNDAAVAIALYLFGDVNAFVEKINSLAESFGLKNTHFYDASGYSEKNTTTAREMASFARIYIERFSETLYKFHAQPGFKYPKEQNLSDEDRKKTDRSQDFSAGFPDNISMGIYQKNTNPLLGKLEGCDGLKTGYIDESGYNLSLTVKRDNMRILSVTMGGPGSSVQEGQAGRVHDGTEIMEWAFKTFKDYENPLLMRTYSIPVIYGKTQRINLVPAWKPKALTVPVNAAENPETALEEVKINIELPDVIKGTVFTGEGYGKIQYILNGHLLQEIPLVAERPVQKASLWIRAADLAAQFALKL